MRNVSDKSRRKNKKKHILCSVTFFLNRALYEIMWKNIVEWGRPRMKMWCMCTVVAWTRLSVTLYVHCLSCSVIWWTVLRIWSIQYRM